MQDTFKENLMVLTVAFLIAIAPFFRESRMIIGLPVSFSLAGILVIKGASRLRCRPSDVLMSFAVLILVVLSKITPMQIASPLIFEVGAVVVIVIFGMTGLTFKSIAAEQKSRRGQQHK